MALTKRNCPECGVEIKFSYIVPEKSFIIEDGKIVRDDAHTGGWFETPDIDFYCSNDRSHIIEKDDIVYEQTFDEWMEEVTDEFYRTDHY
jgi:hypothetical protein